MFKKTISILILTIFVSVLSANILIDVYHSNYGLIDRTVLVFDSKPDYSIFTEKSSIWVTIALMILGTGSASYGIIYFIRFMKHIDRINKRDAKDNLGEKEKER